MKKFLFAPILTVLLVLLALGIGSWMQPDSASADIAATEASCDTSVVGLICARQDGNQIIISVAGSDVASIPIADVVKVPTVTVALPSTVNVTLPRVTVTRPPVTITLPRATAPGSVLTVPGQTITLRLPRATETATLPGVTTTVTMVVPQPGQSISGSTIRVTPSNGQATQTYVRISPSPVPGPTRITPVTKERTVKVSIPQAIGIGLGILLIGLMLGLLAIWLAYTAGYKDSEKVEKRTWAEFRRDVFGK